MDLAKAFLSTSFFGILNLFYRWCYNLKIELTWWDTASSFNSFAENHWIVININVDVIHFFQKLESGIHPPLNFRSVKLQRFSATKAEWYFRRIVLRIPGLTLTGTGAISTKSKNFYFFESQSESQIFMK